jgi:hypothetical protein
MKQELTTTLQRIYELYGSVKQLSIDMILESSVDKLAEMIAKRGDLLKEISYEEANYRSLESGNLALQHDYKEVKREIKELIRLISSLDVKVIQIIKAHMSKISTELSTLYSTSKAVVAYSAHRRY